MRNTLALAKRILQQFSHDPRTIVLFILAPILALWLFSVMLSAPAYHPKLAAVDLPNDIVTALQEQEADVLVVDAQAANALLEDRSVDAVLNLQGETLDITVDGADSSKTGAVAEVVSAAVKDVMQSERDKLTADLTERFDSVRDKLDALRTQLEALGLPLPAVELELPTINSELAVSDVEISYLHGSKDWNLFDFIGPVFVVIFIFIFVFITSGMSLVTERTGGTMERLLATPIKSWQLVAGYALGFGLVSLIQAGIVLWACLSLIGFPNEGALPLVFLVTFSTALASLTLGLLVSGLAKTAFQVIQLMLLFVVPQILLSGIFDLSVAPQWMQVLSFCFPVTHAAESLRGVMLRGADLATIGFDLAMLWGFIVIFFIGATASFNLRRSR